MAVAYETFMFELQQRIIFVLAKFIRNFHIQTFQIQFCMVFIMTFSLPVFNRFIYYYYYKSSVFVFAEMSSLKLVGKNRTVILFQLPHKKKHPNAWGRLCFCCYRDMLAYLV